MKNYVIQAGLLIGLAIFAFACTDDPSETPGLTAQERQLTAFEWKAAAFEVSSNGTTIPTPLPAINLKFAKASPLVDGTVTVNGIPLPALWDISGSTLTLTYVNAANFFSNLGNVNFDQQILSVDLSDTDLEFIAPANDTLALFGLISIPQGGSLVFNQTGDANATTPSTDNALTAGNWQSVGFYVNDSLITANSNLNLKFRTNFGINSVFFNSIPAPAAWDINGTSLDFTYPTNVTTNETKTVDWAVTNDTLRISSQGSAAVTIYDVITIQAEEELRFVNQP